MVPSKAPRTTTMGTKDAVRRNFSQNLYLRNCAFGPMEEEAAKEDEAEWKDQLHFLETNTLLSEGK